MNEPPATAPSTAATRTDWLRVTVFVLAGVFVSFQIGKVPPALPTVQAELNAGLVSAGWIVSVFSLMAATTGLAMGVIAGRFGYGVAGVLGVLSAACGSFAGSFADTTALLIATRVAEGLGFILISVSMPALIVQASAPRDRSKALGIWGIYVPAGMSLMMLVSPALLEPLGWRGVWLVNAGLLVVWAGVLFAAQPRAASAAGPGMRLRDGLAVLGSASAWLLAACFFGYSLQFLAVTAFLPLMLAEQTGLDIAAAAWIGALVVAANLVGNVGSGWLLDRGVGRRTLLVVAALSMAMATIVLYTPWLPVEVRVAGAVAFTAIGGLIPGTLFASAPVFAPTPALVGAVVGLLIQGSGVGQVLGPPVIASVVKALGGWEHAPLFTVSAALLIVLSALVLPRRVAG